MKKLIFGLFLIISFLASVSACQYKVNESYEVEGFYFKEGSKYLDYNVLEIKNFQQSSRNGDRYITYSTSPVKFDIKNNYLKQIEFYLVFIMNGEEQRINKTLNSNEFETIEYGYPNNIDNSTFRFEIVSPSNLEYIFEKRDYQKEICKLCGNEICLDDGATCNPLYDNSKCGSNICNIAGFCGAIGTPKVVDCLEGYFNCNDKRCIKRDSVDFPNSVEIGCEDACVYGGDTGKCFENPISVKEREDAIKRNWIIFGVIVLIVLSAGVGYFGVYKWRNSKKGREREDERAKIAKEEYEDFIRKISYLEQKEILSKKKIDELNEIFEKQKREINEEISKLKKRRQNASQEAKREIDNELKRYDYKLIKIREEKNKEIEKERIAKEKLEVQREKYQKEIAEIERTSPIREIERLTNEYVKDYQTGSRRIDFDKDEQRFMISSLYHSPEPLARFVYKKIDKNIGNKKVHHINYNQLIDEPWNLIALAQEQHEKIRHENLIKGDWEAGIKEVKRALNWQDSDFPEHIRKEIKRRKEQKRL